MRVLIDMNLAPSWVPFLEARGIAAIHWSKVGAPNAADTELLEWARHERCVAFTHDLDLSAIVAMTRASGPSVVQVRLQAVLPSDIGDRVVAILQICTAELDEGAIVTLDNHGTRLRILPIRGSQRPEHDT